MKPLLLLHGALGAAMQFNELRNLLSNEFEVHALDFSGHGKSDQVPINFRIEAFAQDVLNYMDVHGIAAANVFGYSMGGYVALYLAKQYPVHIGRIITLATKLHWDEPTAMREAGMLNTEKITVKVPEFAIALEERHTGKDWKEVVQKTALMLLEMGKASPLKAADFAALSLPVLLMLGDRDKMVSLEETVDIYKSLPNAALCVLPETPHPYEGADADMLCYLIRRFLREPTACQD